MEVESALLAELAEFIGYIKSNRSVRAVADAAEGGAVQDEPFSPSLQVLRSEGKKEVLELDAAAVASSARRFLKALFVCCAEADRLTQAAVGERGGLGGAATEDDDMDVDGDAVPDDDMDVDGRTAAPGARHRQEESGGVSAGSAVAAALFPSSGAKRKRACVGGGGGEVDTARPHKRRRLLAWWMRSCLSLPSGSGRVPSARKVALARSRIRRPIGKPDARTVALAIQRRTGKPTTARHRSKPSLGQHFSRISL